LSEKSDSDEWLGLLVIAGIFLYVYWAGVNKTVWYAVEYRVSTDKVHVDVQPTDCDFMHAPLGDKGCHYEAEVIAYNAAGEVIRGDLAYNQDSNTGKPIVSYDHGKTWVFLLGDIPDRKVESVVVAWRKVVTD
jgi:hypothetical protein